MQVFSLPQNVNTKWPSFSFLLFGDLFRIHILTSTQTVVKHMENVGGEWKITSIQQSIRYKRVRHNRGQNALKYRGGCSGMGDHFDTSRVFEISKFDTSKFACINNALKQYPTHYTV